MKLLQVTEQNKPYYSADYTKGFNDGAKAQYEADSKERRGRWITYKRHVQGSPYIAFGEDGKPFIQHHQIEVNRYKCSLCGVVEDVNTPFCSECGARMEASE